LTTIVNNILDKLLSENIHALLILSAAFTQYSCVSGQLVQITIENSN